MNNRYASIVSVFIVGLIIFNYNRSWEFAAIYSFLLLLALIWNSFGAFVERMWMAIAKVLSFIMPKVIMSVIFFLILTPIALLSRLLKKEDSLNKKNSKNSLWEPEEMSYSPESFEKMW